METPPRISDAEWLVMQEVWRKPGISAQEVVDALSGVKDWSPATIKTLLNRLLKKGALDFRKAGKSYLYWPNATEEECRNAEAESFLQRVFNGSLTPMIAHFAKTRRLSKAEIAELRDLLNGGGEK